MTTELLPIAELLRALPAGAMQQSTHVASLLLGLAAAGHLAF
jgi:hypothetical protein